LPLTQETIFAVAACFKAGGYRAKAKEHHVMGGHAWHAQLDMAVRKAATSVSRGMGVARQSAPFDLDWALLAVSEDKVALPVNAPLGWHNLLVTATSFIMREIEVAFARAGHITLSAHGTWSCSSCRCRRRIRGRSGARGPSGVCALSPRAAGRTARCTR